MSEPTNPLAPIGALSLPQVIPSLSSIVSSVFPPDCTHQFKCSFDLANAPYQLSFALDQFAPFKNLIQQYQHVHIVDVEFIVDCFTLGLHCGASLTHDHEAMGTIASITSQPKYFTHLVTAFTSGTLVRRLDTYSGMSRQIKPLPIDGRMPFVALHVSAAGAGSVTLKINYKIGGPILTSVLYAPSAGPPYTQASGPVFNNESVVHAYDTEAELRSGWEASLKKIGLTLADAGAAVLRQTDIGGPGFFLEMVFDTNKKCCSVGFVAEMTFRAAALANTWYYGFMPKIQNA